MKKLYKSGYNLCQQLARLPLLIIVLMLCWQSIKAQDTALTKLPEKYIGIVNDKAKHAEKELDQRTAKALNLYLKQEKRMQAKLLKIDPVAAANLFNGSIDSLTGIKSRIKNKLGSVAPFTRAVSGNALDSLQTRLSFLSGNTQLAGSSTDQINKALGSVQQLKGKFEQADQVQAYIKERKNILKTQLAKYTGFSENLQAINKEYYYYNQQLQEYKEALHDSKKLERKALTLLKKIPAFNDFVRRNTFINGVFNLSEYASSRTTEGLQLQNVVEDFLGTRIGTSSEARQLASAQMDAAREQLSELKTKFPNLDNAGEMPDFKPNEMHNKKFVDRLEFGCNIQPERANRFFPNLFDMGAQVAYKMRKGFSAGIGMSYKLGVGDGLGHISFSHRGFGLRSFADYKLKTIWFLNGGLEMNRVAAFPNITALRNGKGWTASCLIGFSCKYPIGPKSKASIMILYDPLATRMVPNISPFKLRTGRTF